MKGSAEGSTLRLSLGCLLADHLGIELRPVGNSKRLTFSTGEAPLSQWLEENARVTWHVCERPWELEEELISTFNLPLNLDMNVAHTFHPVLSELQARPRRTSLPWSSPSPTRKDTDTSTGS
jgi:hypothetical protein